jgi:hypothetical protein
MDLSAESGGGGYMPRVSSIHVITHATASAFLA